MKKLTLAAAIISVLSVIFYAIVFIAMDSEVNAGDKILFSTALIASLAFGVMALIFDNKHRMLCLIPIIGIVVITSLIQTNSVAYIALVLGDTSGTVGVSSFEALSLVIMAGYVVSLVFALKNHKWAAITAIVIISLNIVSLYSTAVSLANVSSTLESSIQLYFCYLMACIGLILSNAALIVYFSHNLIRKKEEPKEMAPAALEAEETAPAEE